MNILALSGSLRKSSYNTAAIKALSLLAPDSVEMTMGNIGDLPLFNPDREGEEIAALTALKTALNNASGLIISSPEYAHGISGPLKNALDWLVSSEHFPYMPVMFINTSPRATHAMKALNEVVKTMSGNIIESANVSIPLLGSELDANGILDNQEISSALTAGLNELIWAIKA